MAVTVAVLFTGSVLLHEFAHAFEGTHRGIEVGGITLFMLGGATALRDPDRRAADEFAIAAVGPWSNIVLASGFGLLALCSASWGLDAVADVAGLLGWLNLGLAVFNLVPGAPLDGGRILRAAVWAVTGDRHRSTMVAAVVGLVLALGLIGWSVWLIAARPGGLVAGVWLGLIGAYVLRGARIELGRGRLAGWLAARGAAELAPATARLPATATAEDLRAVFAGDDPPAAVLVDRDGDPIGVVRRPSADAAAWFPPGTTAHDHLEPLDGLPVVAGHEPGDRLMGLLDRDQPLVLIDGPAGGWLSTLQLIDQRIQDLRGRGIPAQVQA